MNKKLFFAMVTLMVVVSFSCRSAKKGCKGNGSWYGNRNLSMHSDTFNYDTTFQTEFKKEDICKQH